MAQFLLEFSTSLIDFGVILYFGMRHHTKKNKSRTFIVLCMFFLSVLTTVMSDFLSNYSILATLLPLIILYFFVKYVYEIPALTLIIRIGVASLVISIAAYVAIIIFNYFLQVDFVRLMVFGRERVYYKITSKALLILMAWITSKAFTHEQVKASYFSIVTAIILIINVIITFFGIQLYNQIESANKMEFAYVAMSLVIITILSVLIMDLAFKTIMREREASKIAGAQKSYEQQFHHFQEIEGVFNTINQQRHDYIGHLQVLYAMMRNNDFDDAASYINSLIKREETFNPTISVKNKTILAVINFKERVIEEEKIQFNYFINAPSELRIDSVDLAIIMSNLLNNAIEACQKLDAHREIELYINYELNRLKIKIENTYDGLFDPSDMGQESTGRNSLFHGIGLNNVKRVVDRYNGYFTLRKEGNKFIVEVLI